MEVIVGCHRSSTPPTHSNPAARHGHGGSAVPSEGPPPPRWISSCPTATSSRAGSGCWRVPLLFFGCHSCRRCFFLSRCHRRCRRARSFPVICLHPFTGLLFRVVKVYLIVKGLETFCNHRMFIASVVFGSAPVYFRQVEHVCANVSIARKVAFCFLVPGKIEGSETVNTHPCTNPINPVTKFTAGQATM